MADTPPNDTNPEGDPAAKLKAALEAEREAHKATKQKYLAPIRSALALPDDANLDTITATLGTRLGDAERIVSERTAALQAAHDEAVAKAAKIEGERTAERIDHAINAALSKSGIIADNSDDAAAILRGVLEVKDGQVVTKAASNTVPGMTPEQFIAGQLKALRPHYWPLSKGGGARPLGHHAPVSAGDDSCFKAGPTWNITRQFQYEARFGTAAADAALRRHGGRR